MFADIKNACIDNASSCPAFRIMLFMLFMLSTANIVVIFLLSNYLGYFFIFSVGSWGGLLPNRLAKQGGSTL